MRGWKVNIEKLTTLSKMKITFLRIMHIALLTGWISSERSVALRSAENLGKWIEISGYTCDSFDLPNELLIFLENYKQYDFIVPMFHGTYGEDGQITAFLGTLGCKYASSDFSVHALCMNKYHTNLVIETIGICIPETIFLKKWESIDTDILSYPRFIKPNQWGSSVSNFIVKNPEECQYAINSITADDILIQSLIPGREFTVWVYKDRDWIHILPMVEICPKNEFFDFEEKYNTDGSNEVFKDLPENIQKPLEEMSSKIYDFLDCRWVVRIDWRYDGENIYFLEVNTIPGFTSGSLVPKMWRNAGKNEKEFIEMLLY